MENSKRHKSPSLGDGGTAVVTGGAGGIGSAICKRLAEAGRSIIITYNSNATKATALLSELKGSNHSIFHAPVNDSAALSKLAAFVEKKYGKLDLL
jgi:3-oxoacyl-[acyl-carrier protein] reductase